MIEKEYYVIRNYENEPPTFWNKKEGIFKNDLHEASIWDNFQDILFDYAKIIKEFPYSGIRKILFCS